MHTGKRGQGLRQLCFLFVDPFMEEINVLFFLWEINVLFVLIGDLLCPDSFKSAHMPILRCYKLTIDVIIKITNKIVINTI